MDVQRYLERIGMRLEDVSYTYEFLKVLQHNHICSVPYENLDILNGKFKKHKKICCSIQNQKLVFETVSSLPVAFELGDWNACTTADIKEKSVKRIRKRTKSVKTLK